MKVKKNKKKQRPITLIEIMIVILLIGLIGGALAFNMRGSMDEGKKFKTRQNISRVENILMMEYAEGKSSLDDIVHDWQKIVAKSSLVKKGSDLTVDAWNDKLTVALTNGDITITSKNLPNDNN
jgi:type II secretory pathway pseudopilin PulG